MGKHLTAAKISALKMLLYVRASFLYDKNIIMFRFKVAITFNSGQRQTSR